MMLKGCKVLLLLTVVIAATSCQERDRNFEGKISAVKNGQSWQAEPTVRLIENFNTLEIEGNVYNAKGYHRELLLLQGVDFEMIREQVDTVHVRFPGDSLTLANYLTSIDGGDVHGESYRIVRDTAVNNWVEITAIDGEVIRGSFELSFYRDTSFGDPSSPDTLTFENGEFHVQIDERMCCEK